MATQTLPKRMFKLVDDLARRLTAPAGLNEPFILQDRIPQSKTRHAVVIWDRWDGMDRVERSKIILDAYKKSGILHNDSITVAMGLTQQEALQMGFLPYSIVTARRESEPVKLENMRTAMEKAGGVQVRTGALLQLRFPTLELAQEAYTLLAKKIPGPYWLIQQETGSTDSR